MQQKKFKVTFIGAGSIGFTRGLLADLLAVPEFHNIDVSFMDINPRNLDMVYQLCQRDIEANGLDIKIKTTLDRREALKDAKYVIDCARIGLLDAFELDVNIPLKYGVDQCVGDTLCAGGVMYAQRDIAMLKGHVPGYPRGGRARLHAAQLHQSQCHGHLVVQQVRQGAHGRPVPRRAGRPRADREGPGL